MLFDQNDFMHVAFLLLPQFSTLCLANALEPLRAANQIAQKPLFRWTLASLDGAPVASSSAIALQPDAGLADLTGGAVAADFLFVLSSFDFQRHAGRDLARGLRAWAKTGRPLGGLDTGAWSLARAGLLDGHRATIHIDNFETFVESFPRVVAVEERFVIDRGRVTAGGATITLDLMLHLIREQAGQRVRDGVADMLLYDRDRSGAGPQRPQADQGAARYSSALSRALAIMRATLDDPLPIERLARRAGLSQRQLERLCRRELGTTAIGHYLALRVDAAQLLIRDTDMPLADIAARSGFASVASLRRAYVARYGMSPQTARRQRAWMARPQAPRAEGRP